MASMDRWTHPAFDVKGRTNVARAGRARATTKFDPMLMDGLESMNNSAGGTWTAQPKPQQMGQWASLIGAGLDFLGKKKELDLQKDQIQASLIAAQKAKEVAILQLEAAKIQREAATAQAEADKKGALARSAGLGIDVGKLILPVAIAGGVAILFMMKKKR